MNQNKNNKVRDFFRKEGFYFILFLCLCVVATTAAFTIKKNNAVKQTNKPEKEFTLKVEEKDPSKETSTLNKQNADRVENVTEEEEIATEENDEVATNEESAQVSTEITEVKLALPLEGLVAREFGTMIRIKETKGETSDWTRRGVDLKASVGDVVKAAAEGQIIEVNNIPADGYFVVIAHANGLTTKYCNLAKEINVAVGDTVAEGDEIGTVGNTSTIFTEKVCAGTVLNLQVQDANGNDVDPAKYFSF